MPVYWDWVPPGRPLQPASPAVSLAAAGLVSCRQDGGRSTRGTGTSLSFFTFWRVAREGAHASGLAGTSTHMFTDHAAIGAADGSLGLLVLTAWSEES